jgi:enamine deaminase RidA (YjgF/YER057c/UK114 family)
LFFSDPRGRDYSDAVVANGFAFVSGQTALDADDNVVGPGDFDVQLRQTFRNLETTLARCGTSLEHVLKLTAYFKRIDEDYAAFARIRREVLRAPFPASTGVRADLILPDLLIEIDAVAVVPEGTPTRLESRDTL